MNKKKPTARLAIVYKNFAAWKGVSHIGLGVAALNNAIYLNERGVDAVVFPVKNNIDIVRNIKEYAEERKENLTHVVISAPWLSTRDIAAIVQYFPMIQFAIVSHSNVGFLQADPQGIHLLRDYLELAHKYDNFTVGGNSERFVRWVSTAYDENTVLLPNMYPVPKNIVIKKCHEWDVINIGSFGAIRPLKNQLTAAAAAIVISKELNTKVNFNLSAGREEAGGNIVLNSIQQMAKDIPNFNVVLNGWSDWLRFRKTVAAMDLLIHPSYTESFNMVSADGVSQGVPVVGSTAITWLPEDWKADSDDAIGIADLGVKLLKEGAKAGVKALEKHNQGSLKFWEQFLQS